MLSKQQHYLLKLSEECVEVSHIIHKILLFGLNDVHPDTGVSNISALKKEVCDLMATLEVVEECIWPEGEDFFLNFDAILTKKEKMAKYFKYSQERGMTDDTTIGD